MLREDFDKWPIILIADDILDELEMHVTSFGYLEDESIFFVKLSDGSIEKKNRQLMRLDKLIYLLENKQELALDKSNIKQIRKKEAKIEKEKIRQNILANISAIATAIGAS